MLTGGIGSSDDAGEDATENDKTLMLYNTNTSSISHLSQPSLHTDPAIKKPLLPPKENSNVTIRSAGTKVRPLR